MPSVFEVLERLREASIDEYDKGKRFERLIKAYLLTDPGWASVFEDVLLWTEWEDRPSDQDVGVDLIGVEADTGNLWAIQCKFYEEDHYIDKKLLGTYFAELGKEAFSAGLIVTTSDNWSKNAEETLNAQSKRVQRIGMAELEASPIDWGLVSIDAPEILERVAQKELRPHQTEALSDVMRGFEDHDRGKLVMACGTGKTFTSLKIAEEMLPNGGNVLFLVPSIALLSQTLREWTAEAGQELKSFAVCSDVSVGKNKDDQEDIHSFDLAYPATTNVERLVENHSIHTKSFSGLVVTFSTYQSIEVVAEAQSRGLPEFDLIICDEAHRTTGVTLSGDDESAFVRVHDQDFIKGKKRLYMTATPRVYAEKTKAKASEYDAELASMDDETLYGPEFHRLMFGAAVAQGLLSDYRVVILTVSEEHVADLMATGRGGSMDLPLDEITRIIGCYNGLSKRSSEAEEFGTDSQPMKRAVAFSATIKASEKFAHSAGEVVNRLLLTESDMDSLRVETAHVDGKDNVLIRNKRLEWLKAEPRPGTVRVLSNARCLSEGVDVPALDAVLFLSPRNSVVDVVQSVGRVMRRAPGKAYGYVIVPVTVADYEDPKTALDDNKRFKTVWQVLQALRSHDERFAAMVNQIDLDKKKPETVIFGPGFGSDDEGVQKDPKEQLPTLPLFDVEGWKDSVLGKIVAKVGQRTYWESWAKDVAAISSRYQLRVEAILSSGDKEVLAAFERFLKGLRTNLNPSVTEKEAVEMLAQHLVTKPVFDALFENYSFSSHNPVAVTMDGMIQALEGAALEVETESLDKFYESVRVRIAGVTSAEGKQAVIKELYEKFFSQGAFKTTADKLGIVYTPVPVVDYMIHAVEKVLRQEFGTSIADEGVHVLDPFTGTGTFITRLLQSGLIPSSQIDHKYRYELHANEIVLLAYYVAAVNVEETFHALVPSENYVPFEGMVLTDTFQMSEGDQSGRFRGSNVFGANSSRVLAQNDEEIRVIISNPPYSVGQEVEGDGDGTEDYPDLDERIRATYVARSHAKLNRSVFDSYIRAFRWASDRIRAKGVICFVSGGGWLDSAAASGMRRSLVDEFNQIYVFNLRGNVRTTQGDRRRREGDGIFGQGSRTASTITLLVKNPESSDQGRIFYCDVGDYLSSDEKLARLATYTEELDVPWVEIIPNLDADWINQRRDEFNHFLPICDPNNKGKDREAVFTNFSSGVKSNRDAWIYSFGKATVEDRMSKFVTTYNQVLEADTTGDLAAAERLSSGLKWDRELSNARRRHRSGEFNSELIVKSLYRPFTTEWYYFDSLFNNTVYQMPSFAPVGEAVPPMIVVSGIGSSSGFSALMTNLLPNLHLLDSSQVFPLFWFEEPPAAEGLFEGSQDRLVRREGISEWALGAFQKAFGRSVTREQIFHYVYGIFHSPSYVETYEDNLVKERPRVPIVPTIELFGKFSAAGKKLAELHLNYESAKPFTLDEVESAGRTAAKEKYRVTKLRFTSGVKVADRPDTIVVNDFLRLEGIPESAWDYMLSGKAALYWIMDRYQVKTDADSGIVNDPNEFSKDPRYIVDLIKRVTTVSVETMKIVEDLPTVDWALAVPTTRKG